MRGLAWLILLGVLVYWLAVELLVRRFEHGAPRARRRPLDTPEPLSRVQGRHPGSEVGRTAAPGAAPPGRPMPSYPRTTRAEHPFRLR